MMKKMYFGAWQNFYHISWPVRFLIEGAVAISIIFILYKLVKKLGQALRLQPYLIKGCVWIAKELVYIIGKSSPWAVETEDKIIKWGQRKLYGSEEEEASVKRHTALKWWLTVGIIILYISAVFVDLPISKRLQEDYLTEFANIKTFFQKYEEALSRGYEAYPPLLVKKEPKEEPVVEVETKEEIPVYIQLNDKGKLGANIRQEPSLNGEIVGGVNRESEIFYQNQWERDDEGRYWVKICIVDEDIEGWLSGVLVDGVQLEELVTESGTSSDQ